MKQLAISTAIAFVCATVVTFAWSKYQPVPRLAKVDLAVLFEEQKVELAKKIRAGMSADEQRKLLEEASAQVSKVDAAVTQLAGECGCAVLNSAAIVRLNEGVNAGIPDYTSRVRAILNQGNQ